MKAVAGLFLASIFVLGNPGVSLAGDIYEEQVRGQLRNLTTQVSFLTDFHPEGNYRLGKISRGDSASINLVLKEGRGYGIAAVCDSDCRDIDLKLYDQNGNLVAADLLMDDVPIVTLEPMWTGPFLLIVRIPQCWAARCTYGVALFAKESSAQFRVDPFESNVMVMDPTKRLSGSACRDTYDVFLSCHQAGAREGVGFCSLLPSRLREALRGQPISREIVEGFNALCNTICVGGAGGKSFQSFLEFSSQYCAPTL